MAGEGAVQRAGNKIPNFRETQNYVKTVMQLYAMLKPPSMTPGSQRTPTRIHMEIPVGGAARRGNLPPVLAADGPIAAAVAAQAGTAHE